MITSDIIQNDTNIKKSLKILKWYSVAVNRRTGNIMAKIKRTKENTTIYKTLHKKLKTELHKLWCSRRGSNSCSTSDTHRVTLITNPVISLE